MCIRDRRYTERPDAATACVMEGNIVVLVDNSPAAMILPTHFFDFVQEANDYYCLLYTSRCV